MTKNKPPPEILESMRAHGRRAAQDLWANRQVLGVADEGTLPRRALTGLRKSWAQGLGDLARRFGVDRATIDEESLLAAGIEAAQQEWRRLRP